MYKGGGIVVWAGISLGGHTILHVLHGRTLIGMRYWDEILDPYVCPYVSAIGKDFILIIMHDLIELWLLRYILEITV